MSYLNANIPVQYSQIKKEYLYDLKKHHGEVEDCIIFGIASITGRPILFHAIMENGAIFYRLPISAFIQRGFQPETVPARRLDELELWNCFSYYPSITSFDILDGQAGKYIGKDKKWHQGSYLFTVDFAHPESNIIDTDHSEIPHEHKCAHILALDDGNYAAQPNNRIIWDIPSFTVKDEIPDWKVQTSEWNVEDTGQWKTEDTDNFFYEIEEKKMIKNLWDKFTNWLFSWQKEEKDPHLQLYEDVPKPEIKVVCEKHPDTYKKQCPSCRGTVNG